MKKHGAEAAYLELGKSIARFTDSGKGAAYLSKTRELLEHPVESLDFATALTDQLHKAAKKLDPESEACQEAYGDYDLQMVQAEATVTLAMVYDLHGNARKAKKTANDALALAGDHADAFREVLATILN